MVDIASIAGDFSDFIPRLFDWVLQKLYKESTIKERVVVDLAANSSAIEASVFGNGDIRAILRIGNYTPFELTVESITLRFIWDGIDKKITKSNFTKVPKTSEYKIFLDEQLSGEEASNIVKAYANGRNRPRVSYDIDFSNRLYRFQSFGYFESFPYELVNIENAVKELKTAA